MGAVHPAGAAPAGARSGLAAEALRLRHWGLAVLAGAGGAPVSLEVDEVRRCPPAAWRLFLESERCALPLQAGLGAGGGAAALPDGAREVLRERATVELQHVLAARAQLGALGRLAAERGVPVLVLKGGATVLDGGQLDLADVDVLVRPEHAAALARLVEERAGLRAAGRDGAVNGHKVFHLAQRVRPGSLPLEIHFRVSGLDPAGKLWSRAVRTDTPGAMWRLAPADHLWHLLVHSTVGHLYKRGCLRDLLLVGAALERCSPGELREVERRLATHPRERALGRVLTMARALRGGEPPADPFRGVAAGHYLLRARFPFRNLPYPFVLALSSATFAIIEGEGEYRRLWSAAGSLPQVPSAYGSAAWLERRVPWLGRTARTGLRVGGLVAATVLAWPVAAAAKRLAARAGG